MEGELPRCISVLRSVLGDLFLDLALAMYVFAVRPGIQDFVAYDEIPLSPLASTFTDRGRPTSFRAHSARILATQLPRPPRL